MIVYDLHCENGHKFEGWFSSSGEFTQQAQAGLVSCPECGTDAVSKAPMAPAVSAKSNTKPASAQRGVVHSPSSTPVSNTEMPAEVQQALAKLAKAQEKALKNSTWVGDRFAEESRAMHYGEREEAPIHGSASLEEAKSLADEGVPVAPLPFPVAPPEKLN